MSIEQKSHIKLFQNGSVTNSIANKLLITSVVKKKKILLSKASRFTGKPGADRGSRIEDGGPGIRDRLKKHENLI